MNEPIDYVCRDCGMMYNPRHQCGKSGRTYVCGNLIDEKTTVTGNAPTEPRTSPVPNMAKKLDGQHVDHWVLPESERAKGYVRPVRRTYIHDTCGTTTSMPQACAETYARDPHYYGQTFCCGCGSYFPVGVNGEFVWADNPEEKVGS